MCVKCGPYYVIADHAEGEMATELTRNTGSKKCSKKVKGRSVGIAANLLGANGYNHPENASTSPNNPSTRGRGPDKKLRSGSSTLLFEKRFPKSSIDYPGRAEDKGASPTKGFGRPEIVTTPKPDCVSPEPDSSNLRKVCDLCTLRKRKCHNDGLYKCCTLCAKKGVPCLYRKKLRRGPKPRNSSSTSMSMMLDEYANALGNGRAMSPGLAFGLDVEGQVSGVTVNDDCLIYPTDNTLCWHSGNLKHQKRFADNTSGNGTGDGFEDVQSNYKNHGLSFHGKPTSMPSNFYLVRQAGLNIPSAYMGGSDVSAPFNKIPMINLPSERSISTQPKRSGGYYVQDGDGYQVGIPMVPEQHMNGGEMDRPSYDLPMPLMVNEPLSIQVPGPTCWPSAISESETSPRTSQQQVAYLLASMASTVPSNVDIPGEEDDSATSLNAKAFKMKS